MSKARGITTIRGKIPLLKTLTCGVEYDSGELYYDRLGRVVRQIDALKTGWIREARVGIDKSILTNPLDELVLEVAANHVSLTLNYEGHPLVIEEDAVARFTEQVVATFAVVTDELEIPSYQRIGYKEQYTFAAQSVDETEQWIRGLGILNVSDAIYSNFGQDHYALTWSILLVGRECRYQLTMRGVERLATVPAGGAELTVKESRAKHLQKADLLKVLQAKRHRQVDPAYYASLEIDAYLWDEIESDFDLGDFILARAGSNLNLFRQCVPNEQRGPK